MRHKALKAAMYTATIFGMLIFLTLTGLLILALLGLMETNPALGGAILMGGFLAFVIGSIFKFAWTWIDEVEKS